MISVWTEHIPPVNVLASTHHSSSAASQPWDFWFTDQLRSGCTRVPEETVGEMPIQMEANMSSPFGAVESVGGGGGVRDQVAFAIQLLLPETGPTVNMLPKDQSSNWAVAPWMARARAERATLEYIFLLESSEQGDLIGRVQGNVSAVNERNYRQTTSCQAIG